MSVTTVEVEVEAEVLVVVAIGGNVEEEVESEEVEKEEEGAIGTEEIAEGKEYSSLLLDGRTFSALLFLTESVEECSVGIIPSLSV